MNPNKSFKPNVRFQPYKVSSEPLIPSIPPVQTTLSRNSKAPLQVRSSNIPHIGNAYNKASVLPANVPDKNSDFKSFTFKSATQAQQRLSNNVQVNKPQTYKATGSTSYHQNVYPTMIKTPATVSTSVSEMRQDKYDIDLSLKIFTATIDNLRIYSKHQKVYSILFEVFGRPICLFHENHKIFICIV
jgi:hypothetical protein